MFLPNCHLLKLIVVLAIAILGGLPSTGCQRRAYTDLYVEKMASEIRELEDRIYEYDAAYRQSEDELDVIRSENEALHQKLSQQHSNARPSTLRQRLEELQDSRKESAPSNKPSPSKSEINKPKSDKSSSASGMLPSNDETILPILPRPDPIPDLLPNLPPAGSSSNTLLDQNNSPSTPAPRSMAPKKSSESDLEPPEIDLGIPGKIESTPFKIPSGGSLPNANPPGSLLPPPLTLQPTIPLPDDLDPQTISNNQIVIPSSVQLASAVSKVDDRQSNAKLNLANKNRPGASEVVGKPEWIPQPVDTRVVEIAFHPSLCRGSNRQADPHEDGMRIVLQPRNQHGEFLPEAAGMTIVITDPERPSENTKLGRWTWTAEDLKVALEPIGVSQGFHVAIAWQSDRPKGKRVQVHVRYEMPDGRRLVNQKEIELYSPSLGSDAWTPRVPK